MSQAHEISLQPGPYKVHTQIIQQQIDACSAAGGGRVILQEGQYTSGTLILRTGVTLHLEKGATILAGDNITDYLRKEDEATALIFADHAQNIALTGQGTIDGNGKAFRRPRQNIPDWVTAKKPFGTWIPGFETDTKPRPMALVLLADCRNVRMENIRVQDATRWTIHLLACTDVLVRNVVIRNPPEVPNGDGFDFDSCSHVLIEDCDIKTPDDAICLKTTRTWGLERPCRNITVRRCRLRTTCHGFCIGHETQDDFEDIHVSDLQIGPLAGYPVLTGIGLGIIDGAAIRRIHLSNIEMTDVVAPLHIRLSNEGRVYRGQKAMTPKPPRTRPPGELRDIVLENISIRRATGNSFISGLPGHPIHNLSLRNLSLELTQSVDPARILTPVPELESEYPLNEMWRFLPSYGLFCRHIAGLELTNVNLTATVPESRPALTLQDVSSYRCQNTHMKSSS